MLILNKIKQLARIRLSDKFKRSYLQACSKFADNVFCLIFAQCSFQKFLSVADSSLCDILLCKTNFIKFRQYIFLGLW